MERKNIRLKEYDYTRNGVYFITICTKDKKKILGDIVGATIGRPVQMILSKYGQIVDNAILDIQDHYENIFVDKYVIMPNHVHLIIFIKNKGRAMHAPTVSRIVQQMKGVVTKQVGYHIWQKLYYDHIIRNQHDYQ